jgi:predicted O-methyltransferase YrrM
MNKLMCLFFINQLFCSPDIPYIYNNIKVLNYYNHGWCGSSNQIKLEEFIKNYNPEIIVELGSWMGSSTIFMAQKSSPSCKVYAIDTWLGSLEHNKTAELKKYLPTLFHQFLSNVLSMKQEHKIIPMRMSTVEAAQILNFNNIDLLYIDASHQEDDVYKDIVNWWPKIKDSGMMCGDDFQLSGVKNAIKKAMVELRIPETCFHSFGKVWWFDTKNIIYSSN